METELVRKKGDAEALRKDLQRLQTPKARKKHPPLVIS
jgi:hypothetical protein